MKKYQILIGSTLLWTSTCEASTFSTKLYFTSYEKNTTTVGQVVFKDGPYGLLIQPKLSNLPPGIHGFHLHQNADCGDMGNHAGGHYDPQNTKSHQGPSGQGHLGDLPSLVVDANGHANQQTLAPRLHQSDLRGLTLMIHANGDNYSNHPPLGGGGARIACGVISISPKLHKD